jgi:hypothetical protein
METHLVQGTYHLPFHAMWKITHQGKRLNHRLFVSHSTSYEEQHQSLFSFNRHPFGLKYHLIILYKFMLNLLLVSESTHGHLHKRNRFLGLLSDEGFKRDFVGLSPIFNQ